MIRSLTQCVFGVYCFLSIILGLGLSQGVATQQAWASTGNDEKPAAECANLLTPQGEESGVLTYDPLTIALEEHSLLDLIHSDPSKNLAVLSPSIVMNAFQRVYSWVSRYRPKTLTIPNGQGTYLVYPVFSEGVKETGGKMIVGQYKQIEAVVNFLRSGASGDGSAKRLFLFEGPPGTGKTEFLTIMMALGRNMTGSNQEHALYSHEWIDLASIPALAYVPQVQQVGNVTYEHPTACPIHDSPFTLLPTSYQNAVLHAATHAVHKQIGVMAPRPVRHACPKCADIKKHILAHYAKLQGKTRLTDLEQVQVLSKHLKIKRWVQGEAGADNKINAEGSDIDWGGLIGTPNPMIFSQFGPSNPHSYFFNGKITSGNGGLGMPDEFLRNKGPFLDFFLEVIENGKIVRGGMPTITIDTVFIGATNRESLNEVRANKATRALLDRTRKIPMMWTTNPFEIAKTQLLMKGKELFARSLESPHGHAIKRPLHEIMPLPETGTYTGPDGRYDLSLQNGDTKIHFAPHTLMYMASVVAASRMHNNKDDALKVAKFSVVDTQFFQDKITRLRWLLGDDKSVSESKERELNELNELLGEGNHGISSRNASDVWLSATIEEAYKQAKISGSHHPCITPKLAQEVFERLLRSDSIEHNNYSTETRADWVRLSKRILQDIFVPKIATDMANGIHPTVPSEKIAEALYARVVNELAALKQDSQATEYTIEEDVKTYTIHRERLEQIRKIYQDANHRPLDPDEVLFLDQNQNAQSAAGTQPIAARPHFEPLMQAVRDYVHSKKAEIAILLSELSLSAETIDRLPPSMVESLHQHSGYCPHCAQELYEWVRIQGGLNKDGR